MHLVFIARLLTLTYKDSYPESPAPWPSSNNHILKSNETYDSSTCSVADVLQAKRVTSNWFYREMIGIIARKELNSFIISPLAVSLDTFLITAVPEEQLAGSRRRQRAEDVHCFQKVGMQQYIDGLANYKSTGLDVANCVFVCPKVQLSPEFIETVTKTFRTPLRRVDFENSIERKEFISKWGRNETSSLVDAYTSMALVNVVYFTGEWLQKFKLSDTEIHSSHDSLGKATNVSIMRATGYFLHGHHPTANATFFELPFKSLNGAQNMSMFVIRPDPNVSTLEPWNNIKDITIEDLVSYGERSIFDVRLPKLKIRSKINFKSAIESILHDDKLFDPRTRRFRGITQFPQLYGHNFVLNTYIEISEDTSEAVTMDTLLDPVAAPLAPTTDPIPYFLLIATTDETPQIIFAGRAYS